MPKLHSKTAKLLSYILLTTITLLSILPVVWVFISSFKTNKEILASALTMPSGISFGSYIKAFTISPIYTFYGNSLFISISSTVLNVLLISMASYVVARYDFRFKNVIINLLGISLLLPMVALIHPIFAIITKLKLYDTKAGLIFVYTALGLPTTFYIMKSYFRNIPVSIEEAAYIDGCNFFETFVKIVLPLARPGLATAAVLQFLMAWNEFLYALVLTRSNNSRTLPLALNYFKSQFSFDYGAMFAAIVVIVVPSIVIYALLQEQVVGSLSSGSVKE